MGLFWDDFGIILGSFWDDIGIILGSFWDDFGRDHFGMTFSFLDHNCMKIQNVVGFSIALVFLNQTKFAAPYCNQPGELGLDTSLIASCSTKSLSQKAPRPLKAGMNWL